MRAWSTTVAGVAAIVVACGEDRPPCYRGDYVGCTCAGGQRGYQMCTDAEDGYAACVCDGTTPGVDAGPPDASSEAGAMRALYEACTANEQCESGLCHTFTSIGQVCTKACTSPADCPPPSTICNNRGICRP